MGQATRDAFGAALKELGESYPNLVTVDGDVGNSTRTEEFARAFPERAGGPRLCGVAYELQLVDAVPHGSHDRRMDAIVTERGLWKITESG